MIYYILYKVLQELFEGCRIKLILSDMAVRYLGFLKFPWATQGIEKQAGCLILPRTAPRAFPELVEGPVPSESRGLFLNAWDGFF